MTKNDGVRRLVAAVMIDGISAYVEGQERLSFWLDSSDESPFSCRWCCDVLDIDRSVLIDAVQILIPDSPKPHGIKFKKVLKKAMNDAGLRAFRLVNSQ